MLVKISKKLPGILFGLLVIIPSVNLSARDSQAQSSINLYSAEVPEDTVCITLYPCDENGELLEKYSSKDDPCFNYFAAQCKQKQSNQELAICDGQLESLQKEYKFLFNKLKRSKKALRRARRVRGR